MQPKYPVYVISKGRHDYHGTADFLIEDNTPFHLVVEPQEFDLYAKKFGKEIIYTLPFSNLGLGSIPARNWVWEHAKAAGFKRHWILDDNIDRMRRTFKGKRLPCNSKIALSVTEDFVDRYENIAIAGLNYTFFVVQQPRPFNLNCHVYSCLLIRNDLPHRWRGRYNEDTDLCLQVLSDKWCTVLMNAFTIDKRMTMTIKGGNTAELYQGDGRLKMARLLERNWPGVVTTVRKFQRPQHSIKDNWQKFDTPLVRRKDLDWEKITKQSFSINLVAEKPIRSGVLKKFVDDFGK